MTIEFKTPDEIEKQLRQVQVVAENVMRPESRVLDDSEHARPLNFVHMMWPQMQEMERANLEASLRRARNGGNGESPKSDEPKKPRTGNLALVHMIEMLSWGDAGVYLCIPGSGLGGAAIQAVGTPEQKERFLRRFTEGDPKWGAMAMTEPQAGSDTSNIQTTAVYDEATNEWVLNGQKIFCTGGKLAYAESDGLIVVWATVDKSAGRAGMKPFVVEAGTPGLKIVKVEEKLGIRASDTASFVLDNCRIPADNLLGESGPKSGGGDQRLQRRHAHLRCHAADCGRQRHRHWPGRL